MIHSRRASAHGPQCPDSKSPIGHSHHRHFYRSESGFTLVELLIVTTILPLVLGALAVGVISVFKLQSGVANRLGNTADAQVISSVFSNDVSGALYVTTAATSPNPQCGAGVGTQLLGINSNSSLLSGSAPVVSYVRVRVIAGATTTYDLERLYCATENSPTPTSVTTLAYNFSSTALPVISCVTTVATTTTAPSTACPGAAATGWMPTLSVSDITFDVTEPETGTVSGYSYTLAASPINSGSSTVQGAPISSSASSTCEAPLPNTGSLSSTLCLVDFSLLNNPSNWAQATNPGGCLPMSVSVGSSDTLYFCLNISGAPVTPSPLPTYSQAFLGNSFCLSNLGGTYASSTSCLPFYTGIGGDPAFYQSAQSTTNYVTTLLFSQITLVNANGQVATGWHVLSTDAESTDANSLTKFESITWSANTAVTPVCDGEFWDSCSTSMTTTNSYGNVNYSGNACLDDQKVPGLIQVNSNEIECVGAISQGSVNETEAGGPKNGTAFVEAVAPSQMTIVMSSPYGGLEGVSFGLSVSGVSS